jgi:hypothetical protein
LNTWDTVPVLLLLLFSIALSIGLGILAAAIHWSRKRAAAPGPGGEGTLDCPYERSCLSRRPGCWLAVKSRSLLAVQSALGLHNPKPCSWVEGLAGEEKLFIAPPIKGWILVIGSGLPDPSEDVDACFRFVMEASRKLGQVQFFSASRVLQHHAWIKAAGGRVVRAYAWAGKTLWQQGPQTRAERDLGLKCFEYAEPAARAGVGQPDAIALNVDRVPLLAARWSLDPAQIDEQHIEKERGIAGELSRRY